MISVRSTLLAAVAMLGALVGCEARFIDGQPAVAEQEASPCHPVVFEESPLTHCIAEPDRHRISTALAGPDGRPFRTLAAYAHSRRGEPDPVAFAMNAGMYGTAGGPIGYFVERGERLQYLSRAEGPGNFHLLPNGVFFGNSDGGWRVLASDTFAREVTQRPDFGTQSGPMLVVDGELHPALDSDGESRKTRNAVGVDRMGRAHFVLSEAPVSFGKLARYFRDVLNTPNALFLDGSVSQMWDPTRGRLDTGPAIGPLIVVESLIKGENEANASR